MAAILKSDVYRFGKSKLFYGIAGFTCLMAFALSALLWQDIRLGVSVFGNLSIFKTVDDIIKIGVQYHKTLGLLVAVLISVFIGQEYMWKTWQHKWIIGKSRIRIYLSKVLLSVAASITIFLLFEIVVLLCSGQIKVILSYDYAMKMIGSVLVYAALGSVICMLSMLIKNSTASTTVCLIYVLFSETLASLIQNVGSISDMAAKISEWVVNHSIYGMSAVLCEASVSMGNVLPILINSVAIISLSTVIGLLIFRKYEA